MLQFLFLKFQVRHNKAISRDTWSQLLEFVKVKLSSSFCHYTRTYARALQWDIHIPVVQHQCPHTHRHYRLFHILGRKWVAGRFLGATKNVLIEYTLRSSRNSLNFFPPFSWDLHVCSYPANHLPN